MLTLILISFAVRHADCVCYRLTLLDAIKHSIETFDGSWRSLKADQLVQLSFLFAAAMYATALCRAPNEPPMTDLRIWPSVSRNCWVVLPSALFAVLRRAIDPCGCYVLNSRVQFFEDTVIEQAMVHNGKPFPNGPVPGHLAALARLEIEMFKLAGLLPYNLYNIFVVHYSRHDIQQEEAAS